MTLPDVCCLQVTLRCLEPASLPAFPGPALHGALGTVLSRTTRPRPGSSRPSPLALAPDGRWLRPSGNPFRLRVGDQLSFRLSLVGPAAEETALVVVAAYAAAERRVGAGRFETLRVERIELPERCFAGDRRVEVRLVTPLRLGHRGRIASRPDPGVFLAALARRAAALGGGDVEGAVARARSAGGAIAVEEVETRLVHVRRFSRRSRRWMDLPGIIGRFVWSGPGLAEAVPLLGFGERAQVGKGVALGFGRYELRFPERPWGDPDPHGCGRGGIRSGRWSRSSRSIVLSAASESDRLSGQRKCPPPERS